MNQNIIVYRGGDPLEQMNGCGEISTRIYHLDEASMDKIKSYSKLIEPSNVPPILREQLPINQEGKIFFMLANKRNEYEVYPETYIAIENTSNCDFPYRVLGTFSSRGLYLIPPKGEDVFLKMTQNHVKKNKISHQ